jgi:geranylgeranyl pyrophosphate synthase
VFECVCKMESVTRIIEEKGKAAMELARKQILELNRNQGLISDALAYFATVTLRGGLPVFPALTSISYEVVGGKTDQATRIAAALTCIAAAADIHDDVIDQSTVKYSKKTVLGKYGTEAAILAGDALLIQGVMLLHSECAVLDADKKSAIDSLLLDAFAEISQAEAAEIVLKKKGAVSPNEFFDTMKMKAVVPELHCKVGAILGGGTAAAVDALGQYGRAFGISSAIREEFIDVLDWSELQSRLINDN